MHFEQEEPKKSRLPHLIQTDRRTYIWNYSVASPLIIYLAEEVKTFGIDQYLVQKGKQNRNKYIKYLVSCINCRASSVFPSCTSPSKFFNGFPAAIFFLGQVLVLARFSFQIHSVFCQLSLGLKTPLKFIVKN